MIGKRPLQCAMSIMLLGLWCTYAPAADNAAAIKDFGISKGKPINRGVLFYDCKLVKAPYAVERRGLDIYINGLLVSRSPEWPPYNYAVDKDPGDPPPGSSPLDPTPKREDPRDDYWSRKWRYLASHCEYETAKGMMLELYRGCPRLRQVAVDEEVPFLVLVVDEKGKETTLGLEPLTRWRQKPRTKDEVLADAESGKSYYEELLSVGVLFALVRGEEVIVSGQDARRIVKILLSEADAKEKLQQLEKEDLTQGSAQFDKIIGHFKASPDLLEKLDSPKMERPKPEPRNTDRPRLPEQIVSELEENPHLVEKLMGALEENPGLAEKLMGALYKDPDLAEKLMGVLREETDPAGKLRRVVKGRSRGSRKVVQGGNVAPSAQKLSPSAWVAIGAWTLVGLTCAALILKRTVAVERPARREKA